MNSIVILLASSDWTEFLFSPVTLVFMIPLAAILGEIVMRMTKQVIRHRERMAMIERGMNPDQPQE